MKYVLLRALALVSALITPAPAATPVAQQPPAPPLDAGVVLKPTNHPRVPADRAQLWLAPTPRVAPSAASSSFATGVKLEVDGDFAKALPIFMTPAVRQGALGSYAIYYQGLAELRLGRPADARQTFQSLRGADPVGYLAEGATMREAESDEALGDFASAVALYEQLAAMKTTTPDDVLMRLGRTAKAAGDLSKATDAYMRVVYEFPFSDLAPAAATELDTLPAPAIAPGSNRYQLELGRGERLFGAKRYAAARTVFEGLRSGAQGDDREVVNLRLAESDYFLKRARAARDGVKPYIDKASRQGEALFFYAIATRELGEIDDYLRTVRRIVQEFPSSAWAEEALNNLATYYILQDDDAQADATFREMYAMFPTGHYAERAAWKIGWFAYRSGRYADAARAFESGAASFPRSDYRPSWLYWSARAHENLKETTVANARYTLAATDYFNTYYGRLAVRRLDGRAPQRRLMSLDQDAAPAAPNEIQPPPVAPLPPNAAVVRALLALDLYDQAVDELRYAQKNWGDSPAIQATFAWIFNKRGDLRAGINAMKRAYPQYMAAGGEQLPAEILKVVYPLNYWSLIRRYAGARELDPYLIAALVLQESNFTADIRSSANAYGLMQILPSTGRQYARTLKLPARFSIRMLTTADTNLRMGTAYFSDLVRQFGGVHFALATYNAGPSRVTRWIAEKPGISQDEFIDDIPFPETQNYVKRILGTAEDYRRLYASEAGAADDNDAVPAVSRAAAAAPASKAKASSAPTTKKKAPPKKRTAARKAKKAA